MESRVIASNKKAFRDFVLLERWECGIALKGGEVKSLRAGGVNFKDSFAVLQGEEIALYNLHINPYAQASYLNLEPDRPRKLLLHKKEIAKIMGIISQKGLMLVPTRIYFNKRGFAKIELAVGKGKKLYDKRDTIKKRDLDRELKRATRSRYKGK
ncbi:MAG TPA: SsrA-binding protein SmpB [Candidatus Omnitrophota bacterium]|nr:SsrA-binding protein SmpB [Candidatus Omnitrophota bacterium]HPD84814.1 SsrA-binding protein SmpB [Candidatus Omnitrophota bacterium]HRZ03672.1 SsrA-binding protein SmpB [Candidatus Omnitrophota bacterium]